MKSIGNMGLWALILGLLTGFTVISKGEGMMVPAETDFLIDDFSGEGRASMGTEWRMFTDRVMGGLSDGRAGYETIEGRRSLRLRGNVSLENNGGFIQVALPLDSSGRPFDATSFTGVRITAMGNGEEYHIHIRSTQSRRPWQYFGASFQPSQEWRSIDIPFSSFKPENLRADLDTGQLLRIAVVAIKKAFTADVAVSRLEFYR